MHLGMLVCLSGRVTKKTIAPIDLIFTQEVLCTLLQDDPDLDSRIDLRIIHHCEIGQNMPSKYATTSNIRYDENMHYDVTCAS